MKMTLFVLRSAISLDLCFPFMQRVNEHFSSKLFSGHTLVDINMPSRTSPERHFHALLASQRLLFHTSPIGLFF